MWTLQENYGVRRPEQRKSQVIHQKTRTMKTVKDWWDDLESKGVAAQPANLSLIPRAHMEGENRLLQVVLWPSHVSHGSEAAPPPPHK